MLLTLAWRLAEYRREGWNKQCNGGRKINTRPIYRSVRRRKNDTLLCPLRPRFVRGLGFKRGRIDRVGFDSIPCRRAKTPVQIVFVRFALQPQKPRSVKHHAPSTTPFHASLRFTVYLLCPDCRPWLELFSDLNVYLENPGKVTHVEEVVELGGCRKHLGLHRSPQGDGHLGKASHNLHDRRGNAGSWLPYTPEHIFDQEFPAGPRSGCVENYSLHVCLFLLCKLLGRQCGNATHSLYT